MLTALNDYRSRLAGFEAGADDYISKPYDSTELFARVRTITRLNRYRRLVAERLKFQQLFALSPNGQIVVDGDETIHLINQKTLELLNLATPAEIEGTSLSRWISEEQQPEFQTMFEKCLAQPSQSCRLETGLARADQESQPVELLLGRIEYNGEPMVQVIVIDIRERLQMAGALSREQILLRTLVDSLPDYFYVKDLDSRILMANSAMSCLFGVDSPDDMIGKTDYDIYPAELAERYLAEEKQVLATGKPVLDREEPLIDSLGNWLVFSTTKVPLYNLKNEVIGLMGIGRNVSRQNNTLRELDGLKVQYRTANRQIDELKQTLEELDQERKRAAAKIGDQFGALAQKLLALTAPDHDPSGLAASIQEYTELLQAMVEDIREFNNLSADKNSPGQSSFTIAECIESAVKHAAPAAAAKGLAIKVEIDRSFPERVVGDGASLNQVFSHLLRYAISVTHAGEIGVKAGLEIYGLAQPGDLLYFHGTVSDCGGSIAKQDMPMVFSPFHTPVMETAAADSLGLDLAICKALVQRAGGGIWVENKDQQAEGSVIHFTYPMAAV
jgi:PAS domain S-box-containing protein